MKKNYLGLIFILIFTNIFAQTNSEDLPGDTSLPSASEELAKLASFEKGNYKYSVEDYFAKAKQSSFQLSPNGMYLSYREKDENGKKHIYVKNTATNEIQRAIEEGKELIKDYFWANDNRLVYTQDQGGDENYQLFAVNIDGSNPKALTPFENVRVDILEYLKEQADYMIIEMNKDNLEVNEPYKINILTGELHKLFENKDPESPISYYDFDKDGNLRGFSKLENEKFTVYYYRTSENAEFKKLNTTDWKDNFTISEFNYATEYKHDAFIISDLNRDRKEIILYDLKEKKVIKKICNNDTYDVDEIYLSTSRGHEIDYYSYTGVKNRIVPVSDTFKKLHKKFENQFKDKQFYIVNVSDKEDKYLLKVTSDKLYKTYYLYNTEKDSFKKIFDLMPQLKEEDMAEMQPIQFQSRDGLTIHGYVTIPKQVKDGNKVPLIVRVHGGPYGSRDGWGFRRSDQLFASRGYATLRVNFRGSGGYGKKFERAGYKQAGRKMLDDLEDALAYVKKQGWIDETKIAIYGASYGGLATLGSLVKTPDLYVCGVDIVGPSNLFTFNKSIPTYWKPYLKLQYERWYNPEIEEEKKIMEEVSPALNVEKITKPLFVMQGANDPRVNIDESDQIVRNLRKRGYDVPYMVKYNEGHGFRREKNRIESYKTMMGFFAKHLK